MTRMKTSWVRIAAFCLLVEGCDSTHPTAPDNPPPSERRQDHGQGNGEKPPLKSTVARPEGTTTMPIAKPKLKVAADGLPSGHDTPEGAAGDWRERSSIVMRPCFPRLVFGSTGVGKGRRIMPRFSRARLKA